MSPYRENALPKGQRWGATFRARAYVQLRRIWLFMAYGPRPHDACWGPRPHDAGVRQPKTAVLLATLRGLDARLARLRERDPFPSLRRTDALQEEVQAYIKVVEARLVKVAQLEGDSAMRKMWEGRL